MPTHNRHAPARPSTARPATSNRRPARKRAAAPRPPALSPLDEALNAAQSVPEPAAQSFAKLGLPERLVTALARRGIHEPFAIQRRTLPDALAGRDVLGRAQTGSGKTLGFGLPMLARLQDGAGDRTAKAPRGLVLVPSRELARQVAEAIEPLAHALQMKVTTVFGGVPINKQIDNLQRGSDIVVATPGRLIDLMDRRAVRLDLVEMAVLDEADHMADLGFLPAVKTILDATPRGRQCLLFSATLDRGVDRLVTTYLTDPAFHAVASAAAPVDSMEHLVFVVNHEDKIAIAAEIARRPARTLFFVRTKHGADRLARQLEKHGDGASLRAAAIHGNLNQNQRLRALDAFSSGRVRVLVATDVAARGIHVDDVDLVVHYDPPNDHKDYLHRSGRTARAGATGTVLSLAEHNQVREIANIHTAAAVTATTTKVTLDHPSVVALAASGEVIDVVEAPPARSERPAKAARQHRPNEHRPNEHRPNEHRPGQRPGQSRPPRERSSEPRTSEQRPPRDRTSEQRSSDQRPAEQRPDRSHAARPARGGQSRFGDQPRATASSPRRRPQGAGSGRSASSAAGASSGFRDRSNSRRSG